jgi:hypothetical protein
MPRYIGYESEYDLGGFNYLAESDRSIIRNGLSVYLDAENKTSYSGSGATWFDLSGSGRNGSLISSPTFTNTSPKSFTFSGANSIDVPLNSANFTNEQTIIQILRPEESDATRRNPYNHEYAGNGTITHEPSGIFNYYHGNSGGNGANYQGTSSSFTVVQNEIAMISLRRDASNISWFKNGEFINSIANSYPNTVNSVSTINLGTGYAGAYVGKIYLTLLYSRALLNSEISRIFNVIRGRYGI